MLRSVRNLMLHNDWRMKHKWHELSTNSNEFKHVCRPEVAHHDGKPRPGSGVHVMEKYSIVKDPSKV